MYLCVCVRSLAWCGLDLLRAKFGQFWGLGHARVWLLLWTGRSDCRVVWVGGGFRESFGFGAGKAQVGVSG